MIKIQSGGQANETMESKKKRFNLIERRLLYIMISILAVIISLVLFEAIYNHTTCESEKFGYLTDVI